jgi:copper homeostasis protein
MVRPRAGGFVLRPDELALVLDEIRRAAALGAAGVVVGALLPDYRLDEAALARMREAARDLAIVLHRAVDLTPDPAAATARAAALGYDKVLSSGGARTAVGGAAVLRRMVSAAGGRLAVVAGGGVRPENVGRLIAATGVREVHASAGVPGPAPDARLLELGFALGPRRETDAATVRRLRWGRGSADQAGGRVLGRASSRHDADPLPLPAVRRTAGGIDPGPPPPGAAHVEPRSHASSVRRILTSALLPIADPLPACAPKRATLPVNAACSRTGQRRGEGPPLRLSGRRTRPALAQERVGRRQPAAGRQGSSRRVLKIVR